MKTFYSYLFSGSVWGGLTLSLVQVVHAQVTYDFRTSDQGWVAATESGSITSPFEWGATAGNAIGEPNVGAWYTDGVGATSTKSLTSPPMLVTADGSVTVSILHRYEFENTADGGYVNYRINGGAWNRVDFGISPLKNGPYVNSIDALGGTVGWTDLSSGYDGPSFITSSQGILSLVGGSTFEFQFLAGWDSSDHPLGPDWVIKEVSFANLSAVPEPSDVAIMTAVILVGWGGWRRWRRSDIRT